MEIQTNTYSNNPRNKKNHDFIQLQELFPSLETATIRLYFENSGFKFEDTAILLDQDGDGSLFYDDDRYEDQQSGFLFRCAKGDLFFDPPGYASLAHCVSQDLSMSKGIAVTFKEKFFPTSSKYMRNLINQRKSVGGVAIHPLDNIFIYNLITKKKYWHFPQYSDLISSLNTMKKHAIENHVELICIPKIACGLDRLYWPRVKKIIIEVFKEIGVEIVVYIYSDDNIMDYFQDDF
eukprot:TRINITY_DN3496_c0_g1_i1.p1 TRINITY_DN3496_c0_g1~~TRINITY_DN3496_c0_g1_i1.p1  ORF type:complete len:235 (+),score=44.07 TRINITY_DN3496_c0_g1_i1:39-743(+)